SQGLSALSRREGMTLFMVLSAGFKALLYRYSGQEDIVVGTPVANRNRKEIEGLIGFFVNTLVLRSAVSGQATFLEVARREREVALGAYEHQDVPFERLVQELQPERSLSQSPLFQVMLVLQNRAGQEGAGLGKEEGMQAGKALRMESETAKFDLTLALGETAAGLKGTWEYNTDLFDVATMDRMTLHLERVLAGMVNNPGGRVGELELLGEGERRQVLEEWNRTEREYAREGSIVELFEAQAQRTPENVAVVCGPEQLSYGELNGRANQLGRYLRRLGVGPEVAVGICMERSLELVVGLLGK